MTGPGRDRQERADDHGHASRTYAEPETLTADIPAADIPAGSAATPRRTRRPPRATVGR